MKNFNKKIIITAGFVGVISFVASIGLVIAATTVNLGNADSFVILAGSGITNTGPTTVIGDIGTHPTLTQTGLGSVTLTGTNHIGDITTQNAKIDLVTAYNNAAGQPLDTAIVADLGGQTLTTGVYNSGSSIGITGTVTLDGAGDPNAVFIFQAGSTLTTAANSQVVLIGSAQACNVFWQVGSSATLGTNSTFNGNILALTSVTLNTGTTINGRVFAQNGAVTLDTNTVTRSTCAGVLPSTLHIIKHVVNNGPGTATASLFTMNITGTTNISPNAFSGSEAGIDVTLDAGSYSVSESGGPTGYLESNSSDCSGTILAGETKTCTITNDDITPSGGHSSSGSYPRIQIPVTITNPIVVTNAIIPKLPNTGFAPKEKNVALDLTIFSGIVLMSYFLLSKKYSVKR